MIIGYQDGNYKIKSLCIMPQKTCAYIKCFDGETKWIYFLLKMMNY